MDEMRRHPRIVTSNLVDYELFDDKGEIINQGKGRTINLSQTGTLLETEKALIGDFIMLMTIDLDGKSIQVEGRVIRSYIDEKTGYYLTGIEFMGPKDRQLEVIVAFVKAYQRRKHQP